MHLSGSSQIIVWTGWDLTALQAGPRLKSSTGRFLDGLSSAMVRDRLPAILRGKLKERAIEPATYGD
jgi:hypothetical protein